MRITDIALENFGKFDERHLSFKPGVNIIYGPNESGKSTLQEAFKAVFFGFGKSPKQYAYKAWHQDHLRIKAVLTNDEGITVEVERLLSKTAEGKILRGVLSESLGNGALPELHHLNRTLYGQIYSLSTANTAEFQQLDWTGMIRNLLQTSGSEWLVPTETVLTMLEDQGNQWIRLNGRGLYALKTLEAEARELENRRRELLRQRDEVSALIVKEGLVDQKLRVISDEKIKVSKALNEREAFLVPWMMMTAHGSHDSTSPDLARMYIEPQRVLELMDLVLEQGQTIKIKTDEMKALQDEVAEEWSALFSSDFEMSLEHMNWLSSDRGEQGVLLAKEARVLKEKGKALPQVRMAMGAALLLVGGMGATVLEKLEHHTLTPLMVAVVTVGLWFLTEGWLLKKTSDMKLKEVVAKLDALFLSRLPRAALATVDESFFERLNRLSRPCSRLCQQHSTLKQLNAHLNRALEELNLYSAHHIQHELASVSQQRTALQTALQQKMLMEEEAENLQRALTKAERETGGTLEQILKELAEEGVTSLPQSVEHLRHKQAEINQKAMVLSSEQAVLLKEIEMRSQLEELPIVEASIKINKEEVTALKLKRDRLSVFEAFIRKMESDYNKSHQPELIQRAAENFKKISGERYNRFYLEERVGTKGASAIESDLQVETTSGIYQLAQLTSTGTREQLYMALKLAIAVQMESGREHLPLILDEIFAHWDQERALKCLELLAQEADKRQVMIFTCHKGFAELAVQKTGGHWIDLTKVQQDN